jgi:hypothetical protein
MHKLTYYIVTLYLLILNYMQYVIRNVTTPM